MATRITQEEYEEILAKRTPTAEETMVAAPDKFGPIEMIQTSLDVPMGLGSLGLGAGEGLVKIFANMMGQKEFVDEMNARRETGIGLPSQIIDQIRADVLNTVEIKDPKTREEVFQKKAGEYAGFFGGTVMLKALSKVPGFNRIPGFEKFMNFMLSEAKKRPGLFLAGETTGVALETEAALRGGGDITQGVVGAVGTSAPSFVRNLANRVIRKVSNPEYIKKYKDANFQKASEILQSVGDRNVDEVADNVARYKGGEAPLEIITGDEGFTFLERALIRQSNEMQPTIRNQKYLSQLAKVFGERKNVKNTADILRLEKKRNQLAIDAAIDNEITVATKQISELGGDPRLLSETFHSALNRSFYNAKLLEDEAWAAVDLKKYAFQYPTARKKYKQLLEDLGAPKLKDIPKEATEFLENPGELKTVNDLYSLYSVLGETAAQAGSFSQKQYNKARIAQALRKAVLEDLEKIPDVGVQIKRAKDVSRLVNQRFNSGHIGRILGKTKENIEVVDPGMTLDKLVFKDPRAVTSLREIKESAKSIGMGPITREQADIEREIIGSYSDFVRNLFIRSTKTTDAEGLERIDPNKARVFLENYRSILDDPVMAPVRAQLESAKDLADVARRDVKDSKDFFASRFGTKGEKAFGVFINGSAVNRIGNVLTKGNPVGQMTELVDLINKTPVSEFGKLGITKSDAQQGIKDSIFDYFVNLGTKANEFGITEIKQLLNNPEINQALRVALSEKEMANLTKYAEQIGEFVKYSNRDFAQEKAFVDGSVLKQILGTGAGVLTGKLTPGPAGLSAAAAGKRTVIDILKELEEAQLQRILVDAVKDPKLLEALLRNPATYARGGKSRTTSYLSRYLTSRGLGNLVNVTDDRKMRDANRVNQAGQTDKIASLVLEFINPFSETRKELNPRVLEALDIKK